MPIPVYKKVNTSVLIRREEAYNNNNKSRFNKLNNKPIGEYCLKNALTGEP